MDQERTMQFILDNLAAVTASQQKAEVRAARAESRIEKTERQIKGITTLLKMGMKLIVSLEKNQRELQKEMKELAAAQKRTDEKFDRWLDSSNGHNGHKKR